MAADPIRLPKHIPELDGLRAFAILPVLAEHALVHANIRHLSYWSALGWVGVDLFFVLSGFLITGILLDSKGSDHFFRNFYGRRALRIWPLYYAYLFMVFYILPHVSKALAFSQAQFPIGIYAVYLQNVFIKGTIPGPLAVTWSLAIEEHFYLFWPLLIRLSNRKMIRNVLVAIVLWTPVFRFLVYRYGAAEWFTYTFTLCRMDTIAYGGLVAYWIRSRSCSFTRLRAASAAALGSALTVVAGILVFKHNPILQLIPLTPGLHRVWVFSLSATGAVGLLGLALTSTQTQSRFRRLLNNSVLRYIGKTSYGIYLFHLPVFILCGAVIIPFVPVMVIQFIVLALVTSASWRLFEQPILRLKSKFENNGPSRRLERAGKERLVLE